MSNNESSWKQRLLTRYREWQTPMWDFKPLSGYSGLYRVIVLVGIPLLSALCVLLAYSVGVEFRIDATAVVVLGVLLAAMQTTVVFQGDSNNSVDTDTPIVLGLVIANECTGALLAVLAANAIHSMKTPLPMHYTWSINALGCGVVPVTLAAAVLDIGTGGAQIMSFQWFVAAFVMLVVYAVSPFVSLGIAQIVGGDSTWKETWEGALSTARLVTFTLGLATIMAGAIMEITDAWWAIFLTATPFIVAYESFSRTQKYVEARNDAERDALTGIFNRRALQERLLNDVASIGSSKSSDGRATWVLLCDLDNFKRLNDTLGHAEGDRALVIAAEVLRDSTRSQDVAARYGGEELVAVVRDALEADALAIAERIRSDVEHRLGAQGTSFSIGVAPLQKGDTPDSVLHRADLAMYHSKSTGKNRVTLWSDDLGTIDYENVRNDQRPAS